MKGVATLQQHGYLLLMYNNGFLHHVCTATPQYFRRHITNSPNRHLQMTNTTVEYWWIHWISGPWENSVAPSWMGMFVIPKYSSLKVKLCTSANYQWRRNRTKEQNKQYIQCFTGSIPLKTYSTTAVRTLDSFCGWRWRANWIIMLIWPLERN